MTSAMRGTRERGEEDGGGGGSATSQLTKAGNVRAVMRNVLNIGKRYRNVEMPYTQKKERKKE